MPSNKKWFETWFNHPFYLELYSHRNDDDAQQLLDLVFKNITLPINSRILDLGCGNGRHAIQMSKLGFDVVGLDLSPYLLSIAKEEAKKQNRNITFVEGDMRYFNFEKKFDMVFNGFTSFGFFEDDRENFSVFKNISDHLVSGGFFIFDYLNEALLRNHLVVSDEKQVGEFSIKQQRRIVGDTVKKKVEITKNKETLTFEESVKLYSFSLIEEVLGNFGLLVEKSFGNYRGDPYSLEGDRLILIAKRT